MMEHVIQVNTIMGKGYWIKLRRKNQYLSHKQYQNNRITSSCPIYYWIVYQHNLHDISDHSYRLFFTEPDTSQIENTDHNNYMALDRHQRLQLIHVHLKYKGMKMTPTYYIARDIKQIENALQFVKYCLVKVENNQQRLIDC